MGYRKKFNILVAFLLVVGVFANSALAEACFCGQACLPNFQPKAKVKANSPFHMRCPGTQCKSCSWEESTTFKATGPASQSLDLQNLSTVFTPLALYHCPSANDIHKEICFFHTLGSVPSLPLYLQNLTLLC